MIPSQTSRGSVLTVRSAVEASDSANPNVNTGKSMKGYKTMVYEITLLGTTPSCDITPLICNRAGDAYLAGTKITTVNSNRFYALDVYGSTNINFLIDNISGTGAKVTIKAYGVNQ